MRKCAAFIAVWWLVIGANTCSPIWQGPWQTQADCEKFHTEQYGPRSIWQPGFCVYRAN
jgi:hypothetical protein